VEPIADTFTELRRLDLQITGLVYARAVREQSGAPEAELERYGREIEQRRRERARLEEERFRYRPAAWPSSREREPSPPTPSASSLR
jgi:hypothetical protein